jgi:hypothetical protein
VNDRQHASERRRDERAHGKRFKQVTIEGKTSIVELWIRVTDDGQFFGEYPESVWHAGENPQEVIKKLKASLRECEQIAWTRWIQIQYQADTDESDRGRGWASRSGHSVRGGMSAADRQRICGVSLVFRVFEVSTGSRPIERYLKRIPPRGLDRDSRWMVDVGGGWYYESQDEARGHRADADDTWRIAYTDERYQAILALQRGMGELDRKFRELFDGTGADVGARLDGFQTDRLLPAPPVPWNTCPDCFELVDPPNGEHFTESESFQHRECETWLIVVQEGDGLRLAITDEPEDPEPDHEIPEDGETDDDERPEPRTLHFTVDPGAIPELVALGLAHPVTDAHADARAALDQHVADCTDCVRFADEAEPIEFCEVGAALLDATTAHEESRLGVQALGEDL